MLLGASTSNSYWDTELTGLDWSASGVGKTTSEMKNISTYQTWDFDSIWGQDDNINNGYPYLLNIVD